MVFPRIGQIVPVAVDAQHRVVPGRGGIVVLKRNHRRSTRCIRQLNVNDSDAGIALVPPARRRIGIGGKDDLSGAAREWITCITPVNPVLQLIQAVRLHHFPHIVVIDALLTRQCIPGAVVICVRNIDTRTPHHAIVALVHGVPEEEILFRIIGVTPDIIVVRDIFHRIHGKLHGCPDRHKVCKIPNNNPVAQAVHVGNSVAHELPALHVRYTMHQPGLGHQVVVCNGGIDRFRSAAPHVVVIQVRPTLDIVALLMTKNSHGIVGSIVCGDSTGSLTGIIHGTHLEGEEIRICIVACEHVRRGAGRTAQCRPVGARGLGINRITIQRSALARDMVCERAVIFVVVPDFNTVFEVTLAVERIRPCPVTRAVAVFSITNRVNSIIVRIARTHRASVQRAVKINIPELTRMIVQAGQSVATPGHDFERQLVTGIKCTDAMNVVSKGPRRHNVGIARHRHVALGILYPKVLPIV